MPITDGYGVDMTEGRWERARDEITAFSRKWPLHMRLFFSDLEAQRTEYQLASEGELRKAGFRNSMSLPTVQRRRTALEREADYQDEDDLQEVDSLYARLQPLLPGLTRPDAPGSPNLLYREFLRRFPMFVPGKKN